VALWFVGAVLAGAVVGGVPVAGVAVLGYCAVHRESVHFGTARCIIAPGGARLHANGDVSVWRSR
jgi:hypothetical protein